MIDSQTGFKRPKPRVNITVEMAQAIRRAYSAGDVSQHKLARRFNVSQSSISRAVLGNWLKREKEQ